MSAMSNRDYEAERQERERVWQERHEAGVINTISPHSGYIDFRTLPGLAERLDSDPLTPVILQLFDGIVKNHGDKA
jgi:hypothetical protein